MGLLVRIWSLGRILLLMVVLAGCAGWNVRGEGFTDNDLSEFCEQYRQADLGTGPAGFSTKARQIERSLGVHP